MDHIERLTGRGLTNIRRLEVNVRHARLLRLGSCDLQFRFVDVEPDGLAMRANSARELDRGVAAAAADIRTHEAVAKSKTIKPRRGRWVHHA